MDHRLLHMHEEAAMGDVPLQEQQPVSSALESPLHHSPSPISFSLAVQQKEVF